MTEQVEPNEVDLEHPWVEASRYMTPSPIPSSVNLEWVEVGEGKDAVDAAMFTIVDPTGVKNSYIPIPALEQLVAMGIGILQSVANKQPQGLVVADKFDMKNMGEEMARQIREQGKS